MSSIRGEWTVKTVFTVHRKIFLKYHSVSSFALSGSLAYSTPVRRNRNEIAVSGGY